MNRFKKILDGIKGSEDFSDIKSSKVRDVMNGNILTKKFIQKQYGLLIMIAVLGFVYIDNRYYVETQMKKENQLRESLQDVKYESLTISEKLMRTSRRSNVLKMINDRGINLMEATEPPIRIDLKTSILNPSQGNF